jgi:MFS family permease
MSLAALDDITDAVRATKRFLTPVDRVRWFRLAVVLFFVGGASLSFPGVPTTGFGGGTDAPDPAPGAPAGPDVTPQVTPELVALILGVVAVGLAAFLLYSVAGATMEFAFVAALRDEEVRLRRSVRRYWRRGLRLFAFRLVVWVVTVTAIAAILLGTGAALGGWPPTAWSDGTILAVVLVAVPVFVLTALVVGTLLGFTTVFVVPVMLAEDRGVLSAWRRFWGTLTDEPLEFLAYLVLSFLLGIGVSMAVGFLLVLLLIALAVPFLIVGAPLGFALAMAGGGTAVGALILVLALLYGLLVFVGALLIQVPFGTFLRYYALFVLGDADPALDVIPDAREAVRTDGGDDGDDHDGDGAAGTASGDDPDGPAPGESASPDDRETDADVGWNVDREDRGRTDDDADRR